MLCGLRTESDFVNLLQTRLVSVDERSRHALDEAVNGRHVRNLSNIGNTTDLAEQLFRMAVSTTDKASYHSSDSGMNDEGDHAVIAGSRSVGAEVKDGATEDQRGIIVILLVLPSCRICKAFSEMHRLAAVRYGRDALFVEVDATLAERALMRRLIGRYFFLPAVVILRARGKSTLTQQWVQPYGRGYDMIPSYRDTLRAIGTDIHAPHEDETVVTEDWRSPAFLRTGGLVLHPVPALRCATPDSEARSSSRLGLIGSRRTTRVASNDTHVGTTGPASAMGDKNREQEHNIAAGPLLKRIRQSDDSIAHATYLAEEGVKRLRTRLDDEDRMNLLRGVDAELKERRKRHVAKNQLSGMSIPEDAGGSGTGIVDIKSRDPQTTSAVASGERASGSTSTHPDYRVEGHDPAMCHSMFTDYSAAAPEGTARLLRPYAFGGYIRQYLEPCFRESGGTVLVVGGRRAGRLPDQLVEAGIPAKAFADKQEEISAFSKGGLGSVIEVFEAIPSAAQFVVSFLRIAENLPCGGYYVHIGTQDYTAAMVEMLADRTFWRIHVCETLPNYEQEGNSVILVVAQKIRADDRASGLFEASAEKSGGSSVAPQLQEKGSSSAAAASSS
ncbi:unnamed protein product [Amoebophrya sp. A25]|nr:unnamed protein product [Amoebophrya sp. A25]|eukprot:GSA25T00008939001.1